MTLGASHINPVDVQAPPKSNVLQPCNVVLERIQLPQSNNTNRLTRPQLRPCTVNLNDCLINNSHLHKKLRVQHCGSLRCKTCPILDTQTKFRSTLTHREYNTFSPDVVSPLGCKSKKHHLLTFMSRVWIAVYWGDRETVASKDQWSP